MAMEGAISPTRRMATCAEKARRRSRSSVAAEQMECIGDLSKASGSCDAKAAMAASMAVRASPARMTDMLYGIGGGGGDAPLETIPEPATPRSR